MLTAEKEESTPEKLRSPRARSTISLPVDPTPEMNEFEQRLKDTLSTAYEIERELGGAGMSRVFVATDRILGRKIVIKVLSPELTAEVNRGRFRREIQVAAQLQHPHIVPLLSAGEQDDLLYFTMPFIKGESLKTAIEKDGRMSVAEVLRVLFHVGEALDYAHDAGIVHRDIKPANILRSGSYALITDFGVAKALNAAMPSQGMTSTGMAIGTPAYMAPEQLAGDSAADHRIDIYAVGLLAYELLNGRSPFYGTTPQRILAAVLTQEPRPLIEAQPDVPERLSNVVMRCLSKEPDQRFATAKDLLNSLEMFSNSSGEIRTMEHKVAHIVHTPTPTSGVTPVVVRDYSISTPPKPTGEVRFDEVRNDEPQPVAANSPSGDFDYVGYSTPKKNPTRTLAVGVGFLAVVALVAFLLLQRSSDSPSGVAAALADASAVSDSALIQSPIPPVELPESAAVAAALPVVDSQAIKDSIRRVRREAAARKAAADSLKLAQGPATSSAVSEATVLRARVAAQALLSNAAALKAFTKGATHMGGVLGAQRRGDLQTQIDALAPFLAQRNLSYDQFKSIVKNSGVNLFDEFGRMLPNALQRFASASR